MKELIQIQTELKAPKNQHNKFGNYNYRSAEDILEALKPLLKKYECQLTVHDEIEMVGDRVYIKAIAIFEKDEHTVHTTAYAREELTKKGMDSAQITGSASSYARKYALNGLFLIDDTKDPDSTNKHGKEQIENKKPEPKADYLTDNEITKSLNECKTIKELEDLWKKVDPKFQDDHKIMFGFKKKEIQEK
jgi:hypothetical protein